DRETSRASMTRLFFFPGPAGPGGVGPCGPPEGGQARLPTTQGGVGPLGPVTKIKKMGGALGAEGPPGEKLKKKSCLPAETGAAGKYFHLCTRRAGLYLA